MYTFLNKMIYILSQMFSNFITSAICLTCLTILNFKNGVHVYFVDLTFELFTS
jgi:hypothetical protein